MNANRSIELINKYGKCPECENELLGNGEGQLKIDKNTFTRTCKCGYSITITDNKREE